VLVWKKCKLKASTEVLVCRRSVLRTPFGVLVRRKLELKTPFERLLGETRSEERAVDAGLA
jgi:hypothetical protein